MDNLTFTALKVLFNLNRDKKYVQELIEVITNSDCLFQPGIVMPQDHIASLYKLRLEIAKGSGKLGNDYINDFERTVSSLQDSKSKELGITYLNTGYNSYLIFFEPELNNILGILKAESSSSLQSIEDNSTQTVNQGYSSGHQKYSKGEFVKEWN